MVGPALHSEGHPMEIRGMAVAAGDPAMRGPGFRTALWVLFGVLTLLGMYYQVQGLRSLLDDSRIPSDAFLRWTDEYYILRGQNPYDVYFAQRYAEGPEAYERVVGRNGRTDPKVGVAWDVGYPPWSFAPHAILYWPPWSVVRP
jgi:hypothetical protein